MAIIVLEGCDGVGKTTIANILKTYLNLPVVHFDNPKDYEGGFRLMQEMIGFQNRNCIFDRGHLSEAVYAPLKRGYYPSYIRAGEQMLGSDYHLYLIDDEPENILKRFDHIFLDDAEIAKVVEEYRWQFDMSLVRFKYIINRGTPIERAYSIIENERTLSILNGEIDD